MRQHRWRGDSTGSDHSKIKREESDGNFYFSKGVGGVKRNFGRGFSIGLLVWKASG